MIKVFISVPKANVYDDLHEIKLIKKAFEASFDEPCEFLNNFSTDSTTEQETDDQRQLSFLINAINQFTNIDIVVFHPLWRGSRECIIEHLICAMYDIPYVELTIPIFSQK